MYIYAGKPSDRYQDKYGTSAKIQLNDKFTTVEVELLSQPKELLNVRNSKNVLTTAQGG